MCQFLSAIVTRSGEIYHHPFTDSHSELIALHNLKEGVGAQNFIRVEFTPPKDANGREQFDQVDDYTLRVDEKSTPAWFDAERRDQLTKYLGGVVSRMIVRDTRAMLLGGCWIVCGNAKVEAAKWCRIVGISDSAQVESIYGSAQVKSIYDSAQVESIYDSAQVEYISGSAQVKSISGSAQVKSIYGSAQVESISGSAQVKSIYDSAQVESISGSAQVKSISDSAKIIKDNRKGVKP